MFPVAGITAGPNRLKYVKEPQGYPGRNIGLKNVLKSFFQNYFNFFFKIPRATPDASVSLKQDRDHRNNNLL